MLLATIIVFLLGCLVTLLCIIFIDPIWDGWWECPGVWFGVVIMFVAISFIIAIPFAKWSDTDFIKEVEATQITLTESRENADLTEFERATLTQTVVDMNKRIAQLQNAYKPLRAQFWTHPDIMKLKYIK